MKKSNKSSNTKKSLWASGLSLLVCCAVLVGTTFAWFTDSVTNQGNKIQAGRLNVSLAEWDTKAGGYVEVGEAPIFNYNLWEPGYTDIAAVKIGNEGTLALKYRLDIIADGATDLAKVIDVYYYRGGTVTQQSDLPTNFDALKGNENYVNLGTLDKLLADEDNNGVANGHLNAGESDFAIIALHMQETAGNIYQGASIGTTFDIVLNATQYTNEQDGFGNNQYDADAKYPTKVGSAAELEEAIGQGQAVALTNDITVGQIPLNKEGATNIDLNGNKLTSSEYESLTVESGAELNISGGTLSVGDKETWADISRSAIVVPNGGSVTLTDVDYSAAGTGVFVQGENATVNIIDSTIESPSFCVGTNAGEPSNYGVSIRIVNSELRSAHRDGWTGSAVLMNVPGNLTIENSTIIGECNAVIVRGGTATIKDSVLSRPYTVEGATESDIYMDKTWGGGNNVPLATLLLGNRSSSAYQYPTVCTVENTKITATANGAKAVYLYGNAAPENGVTFTYDAATTIQSGEGVENITYGGGSVSINGTVQGQQP